MKNLGIKLKEDFDKVFNDKYDCFVKFNDVLRSMNENLKSFLKLICLIEDWILESL